MAVQPDDESVEVVEVDEMHSLGQKKLPLDLDYGRSIKETFLVLCL